jgi:hypothetical protein
MTAVNEEIELHDSVLESLLRDGRTLVAALDAYIHRSEGKPGVASGTGWHQLVRLRMEDAVIAGEIPDPDADISHGELVIGTQVLKNIVPVSGVHNGSIILRLEFCYYNPIIIEASRLEIVRVGTPEYIEDSK